MQATVYLYNSGVLSTDGKSLIFKKDRATPVSVEWNQIQDVKARSSYVSIGGQKNYVHTLLITSPEGQMLQEWRMPNAQTLKDACTAVKQYRSSSLSISPSL